MDPTGALLAIIVLGGLAYLINSSNKKIDLDEKEYDDLPQSGKGDLKKSISKNLNELSKREAAAKKKDRIQKTAVQKKYKIIAKFYNSYKFIDYTKKSNNKIAAKQMADIVNVVEKNLFELSGITNSTKYRMLIVGMITFKHVKKEKVIAVHKDLGKLFEKGTELDFDDRLLNAIEDILDNEAGIDY